MTAYPGLDGDRAPDNRDVYDVVLLLSLESGPARRYVKILGTDPDDVTAYVTKHLDPDRARIVRVSLARPGTLG